MRRSDAEPTRALTVSLTALTAPLTVSRSSRIFVLWSLLTCASADCATQKWAGQAETLKLLTRCPCQVARFWSIMGCVSVTAFEPHEFEQAVAAALRAEMSRQGISQRTLSTRSGVSRSRLMRVLAEEGRTAPMTVTVLEALCRALDVSMTRILTDAENLLATGRE